MHLHGRTMSDEVSPEERARVFQELEDEVMKRRRSQRIKVKERPEDDLMSEDEQNDESDEACNDEDFDPKSRENGSKAKTDNGEFVLPESQGNVGTSTSGCKKRIRHRPTKKEKDFVAKVAVCAEVRKYPALYQISHKEYHVRPLKDSIWTKVAKAVSETVSEVVNVDDCQHMWKTLRGATR